MDNPSTEPKPRKRGRKAGADAVSREQKLQIVTAIFNRSQGAPLTPAVALAYNISLPTYFRWRQQFNDEAPEGQAPFPREKSRGRPRGQNAGKIEKRVETMKAIIALRRAGMTWGEACREHGVHHGTFLQWRKTMTDAPGLDEGDAELMTPAKSGAGKRVTQDEREHAVRSVQDLVGKGLSRRAAVEQLGYSYSVINVWMKKMGARDRSSRGPRGTRKKTDTESKISKRDVNNLYVQPKVPAGLEILQRVDADVASGMSFEDALEKRSISKMFYDRLNAQFRPTV